MKYQSLRIISLISSLFGALLCAIGFLSFTITYITGGIGITAFAMSVWLSTIAKNPDDPGSILLPNKYPEVKNTEYSREFAEKYAKVALIIGNFFGLVTIILLFS